MDSYLFVYVNNDGSVREVSILEKLYLNTKYAFGDGAAPYVKSTYSQKNGWGEIRGFCFRKAIPKNISIRQIEDKTTKEDIDNELLKIQQMGYKLITKGIEDLITKYNIQKEFLTDK